MRFEDIENKLKKLGCDAYELTEHVTKRWEFYFIRHRLDQNRACELTDTEVTVYRLFEEGQLMGSARDVIAPTLTEEELDRSLEKLMFQAGLVMNPAYKLNEPHEESDPETGACRADRDRTCIAGDMDTTFACAGGGRTDADTCAGGGRTDAETCAGGGRTDADTCAGGGRTDADTCADVDKTDAESGHGSSIARIAEAFIRTMNSVPETKTEDINSYEIFVSEITRHYKNSNGVETVCTYPSSMLEVVINARKEEHEIELYRSFTSGTCDARKLAEDIAAAFCYGKDRLDAKHTPQLKVCDVVFTTDDVVAIYEYFKARTNAAFKYRRLSDWEVGQRVCGADMTMDAVPYLDNSSQNFDVDEEGAVIYPRSLIRNGVVESFWGSRQFSQYIGLKKSSIVHNMAVSGGGMPLREVLGGRYLEIVEFSDFQVDPMTGDIAGEIRLAYLHDGGSTAIVTGGSIAGSMKDAASSMVYSCETVQYDNWLVPKATRLSGLRIAGS